MSVGRRILALAVVFLSGISAAQLRDQLAAERILGPHWRQMARVSGMIFSGTILEIESQPLGKGRPLPLVVTKFRVDRAIVGVKTGDVLTMREWAGAWSAQRAMTRGQRVLVFLYGPSRLGLTSPVGGRLGTVALDARGELPAGSLQDRLSNGTEQTSAAESATNSNPGATRTQPRPFRAAEAPSRATDDCDLRGNVGGEGCTVPLGQPVTLSQVERAIRRARLVPAQTIRRDHARPTSGN